MKRPKDVPKERELRANATKALEALQEYYISMNWTGSAGLVHKCITKLRFLKQI